MSWDSYLDNVIAYSKGPQGVENVDKCCIIGVDGNKWTTDSHEKNLRINPTEAQTIGQIMKSQDYSKFQANGITMDGLKYTFLRSVDKAVYGKKKDHGGISMQASNTAVVIAHCPEGAALGLANKAVSMIAEYLDTQGY